MEAADVVVHAGDWVSVDLLDLLEERAARLTRAETEYWTYRYFNQGVKGARKALAGRKSPAVRRWGGDPEGDGGGFSRNAHSNTLVRLATTEFVRCLGVFAGADDGCPDPKGFQWVDAETR